MRYVKGILLIAAITVAVVFGFAIVAVLAVGILTFLAIRRLLGKPPLIARPQVFTAGRVPSAVRPSAVSGSNADVIDVNATEVPAEPVRPLRE